MKKSRGQYRLGIALMIAGVILLAVQVATVGSRPHRWGDVILGINYVIILITGASLMRRHRPEQ